MSWGRNLHSGFQFVMGARVLIAEQTCGNMVLQKHNGKTLIALGSSTWLNPK